MNDKHLTAMGAALTSNLAATPLLADADRIDGRFYGHMWGGGWGIMGAGTMILFWVLIIVLVVVAVRWLSAQAGGNSESSRPTALKTLEERLAKGEIDVAEFEERKKALAG